MLPVIFKKKLVNVKDHFEGQRETSTKLRKCSYDAMTKVSERGDKLEETYLT